VCGQLVAEFQYAVAELTEESKPDATFNANKGSVLDATFKKPIVDLRLDAVQVGKSIATPLLCEMNSMT
jgi:hypothetical protein